MARSRYLLAGLLGLVAASPIHHLKRGQSILEQYDFIIAGGGTAGMVLANRLSEIPDFRVLVIEAGPEPTVVINYESPGGNQFLGGTAIDWNFYTTPQEHLDDRVIFYRRGKGLGGSSVTNGLFYGRGSASVYDRWVELGNPGWGWDDLYPLAIKSTHFNEPIDNPDWDHSYTTWDPAGYSDGPLQIGYQGYVAPSCVGFIEACEAINIPIVEDLNTGNGTGVKQGTGTLDGRLKRSSAFDSYYKQAKDRPNLDVLHDAVVEKLVFETSDNGTNKATGVQFTDHLTGEFFVVEASKEVIVSGGAFASPQMLMVSGIAPQATLDRFNIEPVYVNENVGQHLNDHHVFSVYAKAEEFSTSSVMYANASTLEAAREEYYNSLSGRWTSPSGITNGFQKMTEQELRDIGAGAVVEAGLTNQSHMEFLYENAYYPGGPTFSSDTSQAAGDSASYYYPLSNESYFSVTAQTLVALSRGNVTLKSTSVYDDPNINPNYYADPADRAIAIKAFKDLRKLIAHPALSQYSVGPDNGEVCPGLDKVPEDADDDTIFNYIKANTIPNWHASGTCQMLPEEDGGVVNSRLQVYGVEGLRVIDVSVIPVLPDVNVVGPVYMLAERGAEILKEDYGVGNGGSGNRTNRA